MNEKHSRGYARLWRAEELIRPLWENATLYCTYHKLKTIATRPEWVVSAPLRKLAKRMKMSVNTLRKAVAELAEIGLLRVEIDAGDVSRFEIVFGDEEPDLERLNMGADGRAKEKIQARREAAQTQKSDLFGTNPVSNFDTKPVSKNDTTVCQILTQSVSNFDTNPVSKNDTQVCQILTQSVSNFDTNPVSNFDTPYIRKQEVTDSKNNNTPLLFPQADVMADFNAFWKEYPNKKSKQRAIKRWRKGNYRLIEILPVLKRQKQLRDWVKADGQFVPRADAYLNQRRWEDPLPAGEEAFALDFKNPTTEREKVLFDWLDATNPNLLQNDNKKINAAFEPDRVQFEQIVLKCGGNLQKAFQVLRHGWQKGCFTMRAICERTAAYLDEIREDGK